MSLTVSAVFDGKTIIPHDPISLPAGQEVRVTIVAVERRESDELAPFADLERFGVDDPNLPTDLSANHDHYLYGTPKQSQ
jgi:hypothetical protein